MSEYNYRHDLDDSERIDLLFECIQDLQEAVESLQEEVDIIVKHLDGEDWSFADVNSLKPSYKCGWEKRTFSDKSSGNVLFCSSICRSENLIADQKNKLT